VNIRGGVVRCIKSIKTKLHVYTIVFTSAFQVK